MSEVRFMGADGKVRTIQAPGKIQILVKNADGTEQVLEGTPDVMPMLPPIAGETMRIDNVSDRPCWPTHLSWRELREIELCDLLGAADRRADKLEQSITALSKQIDDALHHIIDQQEALYAARDAMGGSSLIDALLQANAKHLGFDVRPYVPQSQQDGPEFRFVTIDHRAGLKAGVRG